MNMIEKNKCTPGGKKYDDRVKKLRGLGAMIKIAKKVFSVI